MDDIEQKEIDKKAIERMRITINKQLKYMRLAFLIIFGGIGIVFLIAGLICIMVNVKGEDINPGFIFTPMGGLFLLLGLLLFILIPKETKHPERYMKRIKRFNYPSVFILNAKIDSLTEEVEYLKNKVRDLENNRR